MIDDKYFSNAMNSLQFLEEKKIHLSVTNKGLSQNEKYQRIQCQLIVRTPLIERSRRMPAQKSPFYE